MSRYVPSFVFLLGMATNRLALPWMILRSRTTKQSSKMIVAYPFSFSLSDTGKTFTSVIRIRRPPVLALDAPRDEDPSPRSPAASRRQLPPGLPRRLRRREQAEHGRTAPRHPGREGPGPKKFPLDFPDLRPILPPGLLEVVPQRRGHVPEGPVRRDLRRGGRVPRQPPKPRVPLPGREAEGRAHDDGVERHLPRDRRQAL